ncbi:amyloid-beta A4 precursor protein-binding family A member 3 [Emydura macquarii macquarii]|uniref:amyloid-beta A4 precursor protein-binding family A member 3 n=1 Tax=Emydura macquarii macquarii TaxID=1129001 RepID=UPI00352AF478
MDIQSDASLAGERLEPPAMDLEEGASPKASEQSLHSLQQPGSPFRALCADLNSSAAAAELSLSAATEEPTVPESVGSMLRGLQTPSSSAAVDSDLQAAGEARGDAAAPGGDGDWEGNPEGARWAAGCLRAPASTEQSELVCMDLDEELEAEPPQGREDWAESLEEADQAEIQGLLAQLQTLSPSFCDHSPAAEDDPLLASDCGAGPFGGDAAPPHKRALGHCRGLPGECRPCLLHIATGRGLAMPPCHAQRPARSRRSRESHGLLFAEADRADLLSLLCHEGGLPAEASEETPLARSDVLAGTDGGVLPCQECPEAVQVEELGSSQTEGSCRWYRRRGAREEDSACVSPGSRDSSPESPWVAMSPAPGQGPERLPDGSTAVKESLASYPVFKEVPGPCEPEDLLDGVIFGAKYLGSTQLVSERNPPTSVRMAQAQEAMDRIKAPDGESQPMTEVDLFVSTQRIKVLTADSQEAMMDHPLQTISYIADIGNIIVLMARRKLPRRADASGEKRLYKMICHVFHSADAQLLARAIGQAFSVAYQQFLQASGIDPSQHISAPESQELHNGDLAHFSKQENCKDVCIRKQKGEILGVAVVESGWGSILPTVVIANLMHGGPAEKCGELSIGDRLMSVNGTSLVGLPLSMCQSIIRDLKPQTEVTLNIVHCPPVTTAIIHRPDSKYPLGFCVEDGVICSLIRGGIAERGGIRVGHRIIEINGQSVVATAHEKIIQILTQAVSEVHIKTMPASTYRLLTGQEQPSFL